jgi:ferredoxin
MSIETKEHLVSFFDPAFAPMAIKEDEQLSEVLDATNSPVLFGCRTGICGTCVIEVEGDLPPPEDEEKELLELYAPDNPKARLACQIELTGPIRVRPLNFD